MLFHICEATTHPAWPLLHVPMPAFIALLNVAVMDLVITYKKIIIKHKPLLFTDYTILVLFLIV